MIATYEYLCESGHETTARRRMECRDEAPSCATCGEPSKRSLFPISFFWRMGREGILRSNGNPGDSTGRVSTDRAPVRISMTGGKAHGVVAE